MSDPQQTPDPDLEGAGLSATGSTAADAAPGQEGAGTTYGDPGGPGTAAQETTGGDPDADLAQNASGDVEGGTDS